MRQAEILSKRGGAPVGDLHETHDLADRQHAGKLYQKLYYVLHIIPIIETSFSKIQSLLVRFW
jgi:hypothetical protein